MSENADNLYSRMVYDSLPGHILVSCGTADPHLRLWNIDAAEAHGFGESGASARGAGDGFVCLATGEDVDCYDS